MNKPKIKIELDLSDKIIAALGIAGVLILIGLPTFYYTDLPDLVPKHYNLNGEPDDYSGKGIIWAMPIIGLIIYAGMLLLNKHPNIFNYPKEVTEENAEQLYRIATKMIRLLSTIITWFLAYITYATIQTALGKQNGLGKYFSILFVIMIFGSIGYSILITRKKKPIG